MTFNFNFILFYFGVLKIMAIYLETTAATTGVKSAALVANPTLMDSVLCAIQSDRAATGFDKVIVGLIHALAGAVIMNKRHSGALLNFGGSNNN